MTRAAAIAAAERGFAIFPLPPGSKEADLKGWPEKACADPGRVARFWPSDRHNIAVAAGASNLVLIDLDAHEELPGEWQLPGVHDGRGAFSQVCDWAGMDWPWTYTVATPNDGWHLYFRAPEGATIGCTASIIAPQVDVKAGRGYVVGAGSVVGGREYYVLWDHPVAPLPPWITRLLTPEVINSDQRSRANAPQAINPDQRLAALIREVEQSQAGDRTGPLFWAACRLGEMIRDGQAAEADGELLVQAAVRAGIVGGERYARQQVRGGMRQAA